MLLADMQHEAVDSTSAGTDDVMGTMDNDFQWESVPHDLRDNDTFMLAVPYDFLIDVINIYTLDTSAYIHSASTIETPAEALVLSSYLGATPHSPTIAISLSKLELYRHLRLRKPSLSVEAFTKVLCDLYHWPYHRRYCTALADAFDVYLTIHHNIDVQVLKTLGRDSESWRVLNACPPCTYELRDEPELVFRRMIVFDGNNLLSRLVPLGGCQVGDTHIFNSDYYPEPDYINAHASQSNTLSSDDENINPTSQMHAGQDPELMNTSPATSACTDNWKAAAVDAKKKSWGIFKETGIFASACCHGLVLWIADMVRSGELFKYPLAIVGKALETLGSHLLVGYDVGCKLAITIASSSLAQKFDDAEYCMCVDAFYGYTHSYVCRDKNHPNVIKGMGIKDLATMEHIFSSSNQLGPVTHYALAYNHCVSIDSFFKQWDEDKYLNLSNMLYKNYLQVCQIIEEQGTAIREAKILLSISDDDLKMWSTEQSQYLATSGQEAEWDVHAVVYVELLQKLREARYVSHVVALELKMGYLETLKYMSQHEYHRALDNLQQLVVLRLFELHKLNISQTGYRMCTHIAKSLQTRCKAIQNAVKSYNAAALALEPPVPMLDWSKVSHYNFLEEFVLLRETCQDIHSRRWAEPAVHEVMKQSLHIERAHKEIQHCHEAHFTWVILEANNASNPICGALEEFCQCRRHINAHVLAHLQDLYSLASFTGSTTLGIRKNAPDDVQVTVDLQALVNSEHQSAEDDENDDCAGLKEDDAIVGEVGGLLNYISELPQQFECFILSLHNA
ncbi:uncharacterized protein EDB91DRAFT_1240109 [Suillus paluster]|uniref:uncharacterized protein n=1 Tax=Suillus paluster TaxID=48578 RepID=UPI001B870453|nr:uncharacterized protein EDB91DRAFT_1240109 [Suillus paluster]KAG1723302.1 hypothetical protein EDB91DRAFT_1240109 [Suillus paluster]